MADHNEAMRLADLFELEPDPDSLYRHAAALLRKLAADLKSARAETNRIIALLDAANDERKALRAEVSDDDILIAGHRLAWRYKHSTDPSHSSTYTFNRACLLQFARAILALRPAQQATPEPEWLHLKPYGYAPGNYSNKCIRCSTMVEGVDKRAYICRPCALTAAQQGAEQAKGVR